MRTSTNLPVLKVIPTDLLVPHEDTDPRRVEKLVQRVMKEQVLKNPPIVSLIPDDKRYMILDGANRSMAFKSMGVPHLVVQLVSYADPGVELDTWYHVVSGMSEEEFDSELTKVTGLKLESCSITTAREALATNVAAAYIINDRGVRIVVSPDGKILHDIHLLNKIVNAYKGKADIFRASNDIWEIQKPYYPNITALIVFPQYSPSDILMIAKNGDKVPSGVTRHIIPYRALNINIPLSVLNANWTLEQKEKWLEDWMMERMAANAIRYYSESTFSFDE
ncbi:MAG: hypothetical protein ABFD51_13645 [Anaerolineaceae bacterium]